MSEEETVSQNANQPPLGGAALEAMFAYPALVLAGTVSIANSLKALGCKPDRPENWVARTPNFDFVKPPSGSSVDFYLEWAIERQVIEANIGYKYKLHDQDIELSLSFDFSNSVLSLSTTEDFLWGFSGNIANADFRRLEAFYFLCEAVCKAQPPRRGVIGSESCHADEISLDNENDRYAFSHEVFFSEVEKRGLFDWYVSVYGQRWNQSQHLD